MKETFPTECSPGNNHTRETNGVVFDVYKLIAESAAIESTDIPVENFEEMLNEAHWTDIEGKRISPMQVVDVIRQSAFDYEVARCAHPDLKMHISQIESADLAFSVLVSSDGVILDGMHRIARAILDGNTSISAKTLESNALRKCIAGGPA